MHFGMMKITFIFGLSKTNYLLIQSKTILFIKSLKFKNVWESADSTEIISAFSKAICCISLLKEKESKR